MKNRISLIMLIWITFNGYAYASFRVTFEALGVDLGGVNKYTVDIGVEPQAVKDIAPPFDPPEFTVKMTVYSSDWDGPFSTLIFQSGKELYEFILAVNPHGNMPPPTSRSAVISWDPNAFGSTKVSLLDEQNNIVISDMTSVSSYTISGGNAEQYYTVRCEMDTSANLPPTFTKGSDQTIFEDSGLIKVKNWASEISPGAPSESHQKVAFHVSHIDHPELFYPSGSVSVSADGDLSFTPAQDAFGVASIQLYLQDNGGTSNGGKDKSETKEFLIHILPINDPPEFTPGEHINVCASEKYHLIPGWAKNIRAGPSNENMQTLQFQITSNAPDFFQSMPEIKQNGDIEFQLSSTAMGEAQINIVLKDNGGTINGGVDCSKEIIRRITSQNSDFSLIPSFKRLPSSSGSFSFEISPYDPSKKFSITGNDNWVSMTQENNRITVRYDVNPGAKRSTEINVSEDQAACNHQRVEVIQEGYATYIVSGLIKYSGSTINGLERIQTGILHIMAQPIDPAQVQVAEKEYIWFPGMKESWYYLNVPPGSYYIFAYIDSNEANDEVDEFEARGTYEKSIIRIIDADDVALRNFTLNDPDLNDNQLPDWWEYHDTDGDLFSNGREIQDQTNPDDPQSHLFLTQGTGRIPDTNQSLTISNVSGADADYTINSISYIKMDQKGVYLNDDADRWSMVYDTHTGLTWECKTTDSSGNEYTYEGAKNLIKTYNQQKFCSFSDWRLPTVKELSSILYFKQNSIKIHTDYFKNTRAGYYWSDTAYVNTESVICINFSTCNDLSYGKHSTFYVRGVRGHTASEPVRFEDNGDATITDRLTGLQWQKETQIAKKWEDAIFACETMTTAGFQDWRLPTRKELRSLIDYQASNPAIDTQYFPDTHSDYYWSSTVFSFSNAWAINFEMGADVIYDFNERHAFRAVRSGQKGDAGAIYIQSPEQGSNWESGQPMPIIWNKGEGNVSIYISNHGGKPDTYKSIAQNIENDGFFEWIIDSPTSVNNIIKIMHGSQYTTQGLFRIRKPYFEPVWEGNPYNRMRLWISDIQGFPTETFDEIGIFDQDQCVGSGLITGDISLKNFLTISCSMADDGNGKGFIEGNPILFRYWNKKNNTESSLLSPSFFDLYSNLPVDHVNFRGRSDYGVQLKKIHTIKVISNPGGTVEPGKDQFVVDDSDIEFNIQANEKYIIHDVLVDGHSRGDIQSYVFNGVSSDHTIEIIFEKNVFQIQAQSGSGGQISPQDTQEYDRGANMCYTITPDPCFNIDNVLVDNVSVGKVSQYCFNQIDENHTITANFVSKKYTLSVDYTDGGEVSPSRQVIAECGSSQCYTITPLNCNKISDILVDQKSVGPQTMFCLNNITKDYDLQVRFTSKNIRISTETGKGGHIISSTDNPIQCGETVCYTITTEPCYKIQDVMIDGYSKGPLDHICMSNVTENHDIKVDFQVKKYNIQAIAEDGGSIYPAGFSQVDCNQNNVCFNILPDDNHIVNQIRVNGIQQQPVSQYCFDTIDQDQTIEVLFMASQTILLHNGWNIISFNVIPDQPDIKAVFQPLIKKNQLNKIIGENGSLIYGFGNMVNTIGDIDCQKSYQVNVSVADPVELTVTGQSCAMPLTMNLVKGWNNIGYACKTEISTQNVFEPLFTSEALATVIDEQGQSIIKLGDKIYDDIETLIPGEGYLGFANENIQWTINCSEGKTSRNRSTENRSAINTPGIMESSEQITTFFTPVWKGNPYNRMNLWIIDIDGIISEPGDEIGIFDHNMCVGAGQIIQHISYDNILIISLSERNEHQQSGFTSGNDISCFYYDASEKKVQPLNPNFLDIRTEQRLSSIYFESRGDYGVQLRALSRMDHLLNTLKMHCDIPVLPGYLDEIKDVNHDGYKGFPEIIELMKQTTVDPGF